MRSPAVAARQCTSLAPSTRTAWPARVGSHRGVPDVSMSASTNGGAIVYLGFNRRGFHPRESGSSVGRARPRRCSGHRCARRPGRRSPAGPTEFRALPIRQPARTAGYPRGNNTVSFVDPKTNKTVTVRAGMPCRLRPGKWPRHHRRCCIWCRHCADPRSQSHGRSPAGWPATVCLARNEDQSSGPCPPPNDCRPRAAGRGGPRAGSLRPLPPPERRLLAAPTTAPASARSRRTQLGPQRRGAVLDDQLLRGRQPVPYLSLAGKCGRLHGDFTHPLAHRRLVRELALLRREFGHAIGRQVEEFENAGQLAWQVLAHVLVPDLEVTIGVHADRASALEVLGPHARCAVRGARRPSAAPVAARRDQ